MKVSIGLGLVPRFESEKALYAWPSPCKAESPIIYRKKGCWLALCEGDLAEDARGQRPKSFDAVLC
jgi:hypothetical protein